MARTVKQDPVKKMLIETIERLVDEMYADKSADHDVAFLRDNFKRSLIANINDKDLTTDDDVELPPITKDEVTE